MDQRCKGQDVSVMVVVGNEPKLTVRSIRSFEITAQMEIIKEGYLGETTDRRDEVYRGVAGRMELHFESADAVKLIETIRSRARTRGAGAQINIQATLAMPNGDTPVILIPGASFGAIPLGFGSRSDYGAITLEFESDDFKVLSA